MLSLQPLIHQKKPSKSKKTAKRLCAKQGKNAVKTNGRYLKKQGAVTTTAKGVCREKPLNIVTKPIRAVTDPMMDALPFVIKMK